MKLLWGLFGLIAGYPISFFFQNAIVREKLGMGGYIQHIGDVFKSLFEKGDKSVGVTALVTMLVCSLLAQVIYSLVAKSNSGK